ncbi:spore germination protein [Rossellomorea vietnamensis]|uniref:Spore germination protein n=1 Tax=Rossellomorea aquimaris TaxID=189382 RepID=A0A5D4T714_9BACI|nr:spore germination protein [Rossellomorea aquimaris]TYS71403.1 spore germination protein [Rossellomorea aquimaris]
MFKSKRREIQEEKQQAGKEIPVSLEEKAKRIQTVFNFPLNQDFSVRKLTLSGCNRKAVLYFLNGMCEGDIIEKVLIPNLLSLNGTDAELDLEFISNHVPLSDIKEEYTYSMVVNQLLLGNAILLIDGKKEAFIFGTSGFEKRGVEKAEDENILKGPKEAFIESIAVNISLVRKQLRSPQLTTEYVTVGEKGLSQIAILYLKDVANPTLIEKMKKRLKEIKADEVQNLGLLEQHIEERPYSLVPTVLYTERPDRAVSFINEGHVVLLMDSSPSSLIAPVTFWSFFHTSEDYYARWVYGNFTRLLRIAAIFITILTPAIYIAVTNYHIEMLPTDLVLAIAATREEVPFPAIFEVIMLLLAFELIREGGVRVPNPIGPTIGIVGALILGQAAVEANIISPILVIVIAVTGLASFAVPNLSFNYMIRLSTYIFLLFGSLWGFLGLGICITLCIGYLSTVTSFDVPYLSPMAPHYPSSKDLIVRPPIWKQWLRPMNIFPIEKEKMKEPEGENNK